MSIFKTEITSDSIPSDNPIHQRLLKPYTVVKGEISGNVLELGCGEGRGIELILTKVDSFLGLDKIEEVIRNLKEKYPDGQFIQSVFPPVGILESEVFDFVISFQVIEHVRKDRLFLEEIYRLLKPGGMAIISTPNIKMSLSRNPWHVREYTAKELTDLSASIFDRVISKGITGNEKVMQYHEDNRKSVEKIMRFDVLDLQHRLPGFLLKLPYEILNRMNRNTLKKGDSELVESITFKDYLVTDNPEESLDLFYYLYKK
jgi:2-polyprenyl-3-methyl-5-hydroxy-6-metoxy-1,4-benzoquinol methylase